MTNKICENCRWWDYGDCPKIEGGNDNQIRIQNCSCGDVWLDPGKNFGCIHWEEK